MQKQPQATVKNIRFTYVAALQQETRWSVPLPSGKNASLTIRA